MTSERRNWHSIIGPNGMCECGVDADGKVTWCGDLLIQERAAAKPTEQARQDEIGWLVEQYEGGPTLYWGFDGFNVWTKDPNQAVRFARKQDAEMAARLLGSEGRHRVVEHRWSIPVDGRL